MKDKIRKRIYQTSLNLFELSAADLQSEMITKNVHRLQNSVSQAPILCRFGQIMNSGRFFKM